MRAPANSPDVKIRLARPEDAAAIALLSGQLGYPATPTQIQDRFALLERDARVAIFVAELAGAVVGWVQLLDQQILETGSRVEVAALVVDETVRRSGIGRRLMERAEEWTRERGYNTVQLRSNVTRAAAHTFYERLGYKHIKTSKTFRKLI
jgi:GNAT superfamily N-acetyltransferase